MSGDRRRGSLSNLVRTRSRFRFTETQAIFVDHLKQANAGSYALLKNTLTEISKKPISQLSPNAVEDLRDCGLYCLGIFGRVDGPWPLGQVMSLTLAQRLTLANWVNGGGTLLCAVDYSTLYNLNGTVNTRQVAASFYADLAALISAAGGSITFGGEDSVVGQASPWPTAFFVSDPWTSEITGGVEYDYSAGSSIAGGIELFAPVARNRIVKQQCGSGWVVCVGSQNVLWSNLDYLQSVPTGYAAMRQFLQYLWAI